MCIYLVFVITAIAVSTAHCRLGSCSDTHRTSEHSSQRTLFFHLFFKQTILSQPAPGLTTPFRYRFLRSDPNTCSNKALSSILNISMICNERWGRGSERLAVSLAAFPFRAGQGVIDPQIDKFNRYLVIINGVFAQISDDNKLINIFINI